MIARKTTRSKVINVVDIADIEEKIDHKLNQYRDDFDDLKKQVAALSEDVKTLNDASNRVKGGIFVVLTIGGFIGWISTLAGGFWHYVHGG